MADATKITLSDKELSLVKNVDWILTKQQITQKVYDLFAAAVESVRSEFIGRHQLPEQISYSVPKIYKGENYLQLPYVIMDYPRCFDKENIFAVRTMFWWGNFFSITLHLSGIYKMFIKEDFFDAAGKSHHEIYIGVNENQWQHHFEADNFIPVTELSQQQRQALIAKNNFVKLAIKFSLDDWNKMPRLLNAGYRKIAGLIN